MLVYRNVAYNLYRFLLLQEHNHSHSNHTFIRISTTTRQTTAVNNHKTPTAICTFFFPIFSYIKNHIHRRTPIVAQDDLDMCLRMSIIPRLLITELNWLLEHERMSNYYTLHQRLFTSKYQGRDLKATMSIQRVVDETENFLYFICHHAKTENDTCLISSLKIWLGKVLARGVF